MVDVEEVFRYCHSRWTWSHLQSLALISQLLQNDQKNSKQIQALLCWPSVLVQNTPTLYTFVL
ncbi:uncharacterized protein LY79DRAFT_545484 [Colletotrichum navitas]|uniref:DUF6546 domain-containing protein n=1 Tax=Colletotrichum navitas TaxID=681940 RepID=A0AAD8V956_9PEZI|nr:uncharacterized protein LY79DRAFT_545484 [Colletotrichum navitas]KAK1596135.1 hypothetical protein LY79DRAFT_545484 [Colletotrichum navitas]